MSALREEEAQLRHSLWDGTGLERWTPEREERLKELWFAGWSASECARELGNTTRNAVIGKVHREGWLRAIKATVTKPYTISPAVRRRLEQQARAAQARAKIAKAAPPPVVVVPVPLPPPSAWEAIAGTTPKPLVELGQHDCRWPIGADRPYLFCGQPSPDGKPYCTVHAAMAGGQKQPAPVRAPAEFNRKPWLPTFGQARILTPGDWRS